MIIAIPLFDERVSPHFSTAPDLLVVQARGQSICSSMRFHFAAASPSERKKKVLSLGVKTVVCGGIDRAAQGWLEKRGIRVIANVFGDAADVLSKVLGELEEGTAGGRPHQA